MNKTINLESLLIMLKDQNLNMSDKVVLFYLLYVADMEGKTRISKRLISNAIGSCQRNVFCTMINLEKNGYIIRNRICGPLSEIRILNFEKYLENGISPFWKRYFTT